MYQKVLFYFILVFVFSKCDAQSSKESKLYNISKVNVLNLGVSFEIPISKNQTFFINAFYNTTFSFSSSGELGNSSLLRFEPSLAFQYRYYYNLTKRENKFNDRYSANYVAPLVEFNATKRNFSFSYISETNPRGLIKFGGLWGLQRNYSNRFSLDFNVGVGYLFTKEKEIDNFGNIISKNISQSTLLGHLNLGFWINKRR